MNRRPPTVSVVIPTAGKRNATLGSTIPVLLADPATSELIVVLDGDAGLTERIVEDAARLDHRVTLTHAGPPARLVNRGQAARTAGARLATSKVILALDDDVEPAPGLVSGHAAWHARHDNVVVLGYMPVSLRGGGGSAAHACARLYSEGYERVCSEYHSRPNQILLRLWAGNFSLSRAHWLNATDDVKPSVAAYHVDQEFGLALQERGLTGVFDPGLRAEHRYRRSAREFLGDAVAAGVGQAHLRSVHPELREVIATPRRRMALRPLLAASRTRLGYGVITTSVIVSASFAGSIHLRPLERAAARLLWRLGLERGLHVAARRPA